MGWRGGAEGEGCEEVRSDMLAHAANLARRKASKRTILYMTSTPFHGVDGATNDGLVSAAIGSEEKSRVQGLQKSAEGVVHHQGGTRTVTRLGCFVRMPPTQARALRRTCCRTRDAGAHDDKGRCRARAPRGGG